MDMKTTQHIKIPIGNKDIYKDTQMNKLRVSGDLIKIIYIDQRFGQDGCCGTNLH
jgi:hypothetical protein